jgi:hypothetical protein
MLPRQTKVLWASAYVALLVLASAVIIPSAHAATTPSVVQTATGGCTSSPCSLAFTNSVSGGDNMIAGIGIECSPSCSSVAFSDTLGTSFTVISGSTPITCSGFSGTVYDFLAYGGAPGNGADTVQVSWSGSLLGSPSGGTGLDIMEASDALYLGSGINQGVSGTPELSSSLSAATGDIFVEFLSYTFATGSQPTNCNQTAGSSAGWTIWGGVNSDYGLYNTAIGSSNFAFPSFTVIQTDWVDTGAIFGAPHQSISTALKCRPGSLAVMTLTTCTATVTDKSNKPSTPTGTVSFASDLGSFSPSAACTLVLVNSYASSCSVSYAPNPGTEGKQTILGTYSGDSAHQGSRGVTSLTVTQRITKTSVVCSPKTVEGSSSTTCTATVKDVSHGVFVAPLTPTGTITWYSSGTGTFSQTTCALSGTGTTASCSVTFTPTGKPSVQQITGTYSGDVDHVLSFGTTQIQFV